MLELAAPMSVMWEIVLVGAAGLANWIITYIIVAGAIFEGSRDKVKTKCSDITTWCDGHDRRDSRRIKTLRCLAGKGKYLVGCQLCCGVWVGFALTPFVPGPFHSSIFGVAMVLNGLVFKAIGHATLEVTSVWRNRSALLEEQLRLARAQRKAFEDGMVWMVAPNMGITAADNELLANGRNH